MAKDITDSYGTVQRIGVTGFVEGTAKPACLTPPDLPLTTS